MKVVGLVWFCCLLVFGFSFVGLLLDGVGLAVYCFIVLWLFWFCGCGLILRFGFNGLGFVLVVLLFGFAGCCLGVMLFWTGCFVCCFVVFEFGLVLVVVVGNWLSLFVIVRLRGFLLLLQGFVSWLVCCC